jgi:hypothetical protein
LESPEASAWGVPGRRWLLIFPGCGRHFSFFLLRYSPGGRGAKRRRIRAPRRPIDRRKRDAPELRRGLLKFDANLPLARQLGTQADHSANQPLPGSCRAAGPALSALHGKIQDDQGSVRTHHQGTRLFRSQIRLWAFLDHGDGDAQTNALSAAQTVDSAG